MEIFQLLIKVLNCLKSANTFDGRTRCHFGQILTPSSAIILTVDGHDLLDWVCPIEDQKSGEHDSQYVTTAGLKPTPFAWQPFR